MAKYSGSMADLRTSPVMKRTFFLLLRREGVNREEILRDFHVDLGGSSEVDRRVIQEASDKMRDLVNAADGLSVADNLRDFEQRRWSVSSSNVHGEFLKVAKELFGDDANWGRVIGLVGFAVAYAIYVDGLGIHGVIPSVCEWTIHVFTERLGTFLQDSGGWEGFIEFADALKRRQNRYKPDDPPVWHHAVTMGTAVGAIGLGALAAFTLRQAFS